MNVTPSSSQDLPTSSNPAANHRGHAFTRWSGVGWIGVVFGSTLWMIVGVFAVASVQPLLSTGLFALFLLAVGMGVGLYLRRDSLDLLRAIQVFMLSSFAISVSYLALVAWAGVLDRVTSTWSYPVEVSTWVVPSCYLIVLAVVTFIHRSQRKKQAG